MLQRNSKNIYNAPWRNSRWQPYELVCRIDELEIWEPKLVILLKKYGEAFDDNWWYYLAKNNLWVRKVPIWQKQKRIPMEKWKVKIDIKQKKITDLI